MTVIGARGGSRCAWGHAFGGRLGRLLFGGGIRSAAYCLGALQSLDQTGLIAKTRWILGVSGGSYIASSRALVAADLPAGAEPHAYAPGTPEERNLRYDSRYIAPDGSTVLVGVLSLFLGAVEAPPGHRARAAVCADARLGLAAPTAGRLDPVRGAHYECPGHGSGLVAHAGDRGRGHAGVFFFYWWCTLAEPGGRRPGGLLGWLKPDDRDHGTDRAFLVSWAATLAVGLALAMLAVPPLISWLTHVTGSPGTIAHFLGFGARPSWSPSARWPASFAAVTAVARYCQTGLAKWTAWTSAANAKSTAAAPGPAHPADRPDPAVSAALGGQCRHCAGRRGPRPAVDKRRREGGILGRAAAARRRGAGRDPARHARSRERQPPVDARLLPVAAGGRLRGHPAGGRGGLQGGGTSPGASSCSPKPRPPACPSSPPCTAARPRQASPAWLSAGRPTSTQCGKSRLAGKASASRSIRSA